MRVLVTSSRNTFALDIIRKLGSRGHTVVACDTYGGAIGNHSKFVEAHEVTASPRYDTDGFIRDIQRIVETHRVDLIIPAFEEAFYLSARAGELPERVTLFAGAFDSLAQLHDKASFQRIVERSGVPIPETVVATDHAALAEAAERFGKYFARAAFSRGGVALLTNTGPLAGRMTLEECTPTPDQPWIVQPFVDGPMVCTYSVVVQGRITAHCTYRAPEQWASSTGIAFLAVDSTATLEYSQRIISEVDPEFTGQLSFDFVDHGDELYAIECNPRPTNGVILLEAEEFERALTGDIAEPIVVAPGEQRQISLAVLADAFTEPISHLKTTLHDLLNVRDISAGWNDAMAMLWSPATLVHGARLGAAEHVALLSALGDDIVWNGEPIAGMSEADRAALEAIHEQRERA